MNNQSCNCSMARMFIVVLLNAMMVVSPPSLVALPSGSEVAHGNLHVSRSGNHMDINQLSQNAIADWQSFSIGAGQTVNIQQLSSDAALLNRVIGADPSRLLGQLQANGRVYLINPNGVLIGEDARIDAGSFFATTAQISDAEFLAGGDLSFSNGTDASIVNLGVIEAADGDAVLVAYRVVNEGEIKAPEGAAALSTATEFVYSPAGDTRITVSSSQALDTGGVGIDNSGLIDAADAELTAADGNIYALAINQTGMVRATGVERIGGRVLLTASGGTIRHDGAISAHRSDGSGGEALIGGDYQGSNPNVANVEFASVGADALIDVSARRSDADGGKAIVWADQQTDFAGRIDGRAGEQGGDGAFAEVSGKRILNYSGLADLSAPSGETGDLLLDPDEAIISTATDDQPNGVFNTGVLATNLGSANVTIDTSTGYGNGSTQFGDITVNNAVAWASSNSLTLKSGDNINVNANLTGGAGSGIEFSLGEGGGDPFVSTTGILTVDAGATVSAGTVTIGPNTDASAAGAGNLPPPSERQTGAINFNGILDADTLNFRMEALGMGDGISIANSSNAIGSITTSVNDTDARLREDVTIVDGNGALQINGTVAGSSGDITISTPGDLTLASGTTVSTFGFGAEGILALASTGGSFINQAGAGAIAINNDGRYLVYSDNPTDTSLGGLTATPVYNKTFAGNAPGAITQTGNRVLYSLAPTLTFSADNLSRNYGSANPSLTYSVNGLVGGDSLANAASGTPSLSTTALSSDNVGSSAISITAGTVTASDYDYQIAFSSGTLTIDPAPLTIRADDQSRPAGQANPTFTATFTGLVNDDTSADFPNLTITTPANTSSPEGDYAITPAGATNPNYSYTFTPGLLSIGNYVVTIRADDFSRFFGDANPSFTGSITAPSGFDTGQLTNLSYGTVAASTSNVGSYAITPSVDPLADTTFNLIDGTLTINAQPLTITALDAARLFGENNPTFSGTITGLASFHTSSDIAGLSYSSTATSTSNVGDYTITPSVGSNPNYSITLNNGTLTVDQRPVTVTADDVSKVFGESSLSLTSTVTGLASFNTAAALGTINLATGASDGLTNVGTYPITVSGPVNGNYDITLVNGTATVTPKAASVTAQDKSREYGDANPNFTVTTQGGVIGKPIKLAGLVFATDATSGSSVGDYAITPSGASDSNYNISYVSGNLSVTPASLNIQANSFTREYGDPNPSLTAIISGLKLGDSVNAVINNYEITTAATQESNVGFYQVTPSGTLADSNYSLNFSNGLATIEKANLSLVAPALAERPYGDADPAFELVATGLKNGDTPSVISATVTSAATPFSPVGSYQTTILGATAANYNISSTNTGVLNVLPRPLTITADDLTRFYGDPNLTFTATFDGLASFDDESVVSGLTLSSAATIESGAQDLAVIPSGASADNYAITHVPGTLTIAPAPLEFLVDGFTRVYGQADPTIEATLLDGLKLDDTIDDLGVSLAGPAPMADVGVHEVQVELGNPNYTVVSAPGSLEVTPAPLIVRVGNVSRKYGEANPDIADVPLDVDGLAFNQAAGDVVSLSYLADETSDVGNYPIFAQLLSSNYQLNSLSEVGNLAVLVRNMALKPANIARYYGDQNPAYEILIAGDGLAPHHSVADVADLEFMRVDGELSSELPDRLADVGFRQLRASLTGNPNYAIANAPGVHAILPRPITLKVENTAMTSGEPFPEFVTTATNLPQGESVETVFPNLSYRLYFDDESSAVGVPFDPETYSFPDGFTDAGFLANYPSTIEVPSADFEPGDASAGALMFTPIEILPGASAEGIVIGPITVIVPFRPKDPDTATRYVQPRFGNSNYVVTEVKNGELSITRDPKVQRQLDETKAEIERDEANREAFFNPETNWNGLTAAFGMPREGIPALLDAIKMQMGIDGASGESPIFDAIMKEAGKEGQEGYTERDFYAFLADVHTNPEKQAILAPAFTNYMMSLATKDPSSYTDADFVMAQKLESMMHRSRDALVSKLHAKRSDYMANRAENRTGPSTGLSRMFGDEAIPWSEMMGEVAGEYVEEQFSEVLGKGALAAGAGAVSAGAFTATVTGAATAIFPYATFGMTAISASGAGGVGGAGAFSSATAAASSVAAGPAAIVAAAVTVGVIRGVQVFEAEDERIAFEDFLSTRGDPISLRGMNFETDPEAEEPDINVVMNRAILLTAITDMMSGS